MTTAASPTETVYQDLLATIRLSAGVQLLVAAGNIHGYEDEEEQVLGYHESGDMPHLEFRPVPGGQQWLREDTDNSLAEVQFKLVFLTDSERLQGARGLWAVDWAIERALYARLKLIKPGDAMIHLSRGPFSPLEPSKSERFAGERGWCAEMEITALIQFTDTTLTT